MKKWTPDKVLAAILLIGCLALIATGIDGEVKSILAMAGGWLFHASYATIHHGRENNGNEKAESSSATQH